MLGHFTRIRPSVLRKDGVGLPKASATHAFNAFNAHNAYNANSAFTAAVAVILSLSACNPTFNWRETRIENTSLVALMPCKPDHQSRALPLAGQRVDMHMTACDAGGATFAIAHVNWDQAQNAAQIAGKGLAKDASQAEIKPGIPEVLNQWRQVTLGNLGAKAATESSGESDKTGLASGAANAAGKASSSASLASTAGGSGPLGPKSPLVSAQGLRPDGSAVKFQGVWFAQNGQIFHAALYAPHISAEMAETFFAGLKLQ